MFRLGSSTTNSSDYEVDTHELEEVSTWREREVRRSGVPSELFV